MGTVSKSNRKIEGKSIHLTHKYMGRSRSWLGTGISIKTMAGLNSLYGPIINHGRTVQRKTTIISFTCIAEINYIHKVIHSNTQ